MADPEDPDEESPYAKFESKSILSEEAVVEVLKDIEEDSVIAIAPPMAASQF